MRADGVELRAFRLKPGIGFGESKRVTHFAAFAPCNQGHTEHCDCPLPVRIPMLCEEVQYDLQDLDEITQAAEAGMPCVACLYARATRLASQPAPAETSAGTVVDGEVIARGVPLSRPRRAVTAASTAPALPVISGAGAGHVAARSHEQPSPNWRAI